VAVEVDGAIGALVDDERIMVSRTYRQSETVFRDQTARRPLAGHPALRGDRDRRVRPPSIWDGGVNRHGYRLPHRESSKTAHHDPGFCTSSRRQHCDRPNRRGSDRADASTRCATAASRTTSPTPLIAPPSAGVAPTDPTSPPPSLSTQTRDADGRRVGGERVRASRHRGSPIDTSCWHRQQRSGAARLPSVTSLPRPYRRSGAQPLAPAHALQEAQARGRLLPWWPHRAVPCDAPGLLSFV
jgi:hypothetical protein